MCEKAKENETESDSERQRGVNEFANTSRAKAL